ncbi:MAG: hypothetical protein LBE89_07405 [Helicobacteraceae bacterium]|jgi:hypothetical protein|nr:hypothetical protein [Helicobacteraceae bacterium]
MSSLTIDVLRENINALGESVKALKNVYDKCMLIGIKEAYSDEELIYLEALTARYARTTDLLIHKTLRSLDAAEYMTLGSVIDSANRAEKRGIVDSADQLRTLKDLRNEISHEYIGSKCAELFRQVISLVPLLSSIIDRTIIYASKYLKKGI